MPVITLPFLPPEPTQREVSISHHYANGTSRLHFKLNWEAEEGVLGSVCACMGAVGLQLVCLSAPSMLSALRVSRLMGQDMSAEKETDTGLAQRHVPTHPLNTGLIQLQVIVRGWLRGWRQSLTHANGHWILQVQSTFKLCIFKCMKWNCNALNVPKISISKFHIRVHTLGWEVNIIRVNLGLHMTGLSNISNI